MKFSAFAGTAILPLLARLVLCAAFIPAGFQKVFSKNEQFEGREAEILRNLGVGEVLGATAAAGGGVRLTGPDIRLASIQDQPQRDAGAEGGADSSPQAAPADRSDPAAGEGMPEEPSSQEVGGVDGEGGRDAGALRVEAKSIYSVAVLLVDQGRWPAEWKPQYMAWIAALTELLGGVLLFFGLFSRLWGLGLAITMGFAFYLTSWQALDLSNLLALPQDPPTFNTAFCQVGLGVLALGVFLTGPGPLSLDRILFSRSGRKDDLDDLDRG